MDVVDVVVVGGGVVGLAVAACLARSGREVLLLERHGVVGSETSSRNSGVIHSGIYYPAGSLKARLCVRGGHLLYEYCEQHQVAHRRCGKVIVAQATELPMLESLQQKAIANGVDDVGWIDRAALAKLEPTVVADAALLCPTTGIVDVHELMSSLQGEAEDHGASLALRTELLSGTAGGSVIGLRVRSGEEQIELGCRTLVVAAGLATCSILHRLEGYPASRLPQPHFAKGNYFELQGRPPFSRLVYPMPNQAGLGVHATLDLAGRVRFGPDVEWLDPGTDETAIDYRVDASRAAQFYGAIRSYWPALPEGGLVPAYSGVRPKLVGEGAPAADFRIETVAEHGVPGLVTLLGIESPGLTSSLAIAEFVSGLLVD